MPKSVFETALAESPEVRKAALTSALFKPGGTVPAVPEIGEFNQWPETAVTPTAFDLPPAPRAPVRKITGKLPARFVPRFPYAPTQSPQPEGEFEMPTKPKAKEKARPKAAIKVPSLPTGRGPKTSPATASIYAKLKSQHDNGETVSTFKEYCKEFGNVEPGNYSSARQKLMRTVDVTRMMKGAKRDKKFPAAHKFTPGAARTVQILYASNESINSEIMDQLKKCIPNIVSGIIGSDDAEGIEIRSFHDGGFEVRRLVEA